MGELLEKLLALILPRRLYVLRQETKSWRVVRNAHLQTHPECAACGRKSNLDVHHIIPVAVNPKRRLDETNLITLCSTPCHLVFGHLMCYHCYNNDVRRMVAEYRAAVKRRTCHKSF